MDVGLAALQVVVQVVPKQMDQVDGVVSGLRGSVSREEDEGDISDALPSPRVSVLQAQRRLPGRVTQ